MEYIPSPIVFTTQTSLDQHNHQQEVLPPPYSGTLQIPEYMNINQGYEPPPYTDSPPKYDDIPITYEPQREVYEMNAINSAENTVINSTETKGKLREKRMKTLLCSTVCVSVPTVIGVLICAVCGCV